MIETFDRYVYDASELEDTIVRSTEHASHTLKKLSAKYTAISSRFEQSVSSQLMTSIPYPGSPKHAWRNH